MIMSYTDDSAFIAHYPPLESISLSALTTVETRGPLLMINPGSDATVLRLLADNDADAQFWGREITVFDHDWQ